MTSDTKPQGGRRLRHTGGHRHSRRSDEPYTSILDDEVDPGAALGSAVGRKRAPRISREEVFAAADTLLLEGVRPSIDRVRVRLGRGSPNTINEFMDVWWAKLGSRLRDLPGHEFPHLPKSVATSLQQLWNEALEAAHDVLQSTRALSYKEFLERQHLQEAEQLVLERGRPTHAARNTVREEASQLARAQLLEEGNQRVRMLEQALLKRETELDYARKECDRLAQVLEALHARQSANQKEAVEQRSGETKTLKSRVTRPKLPALRKKS
jgi:hypothetical protein